MKLCCAPRRIQLFTLIVTAVIIVSILITLFLCSYPTIAKEQVIDTVIFKDGTLEMQRFHTTKDLVNLRVTFYVMNVTNVDDVIQRQAKINLQEVGPFVYHEYKTKEFLDNNQTSGLITYKLRKQYNFRPDLSVGDPTKMKINWPNVPLISAHAFLNKLPAYERVPAYMAINAAIRNFKEPAFFTDTIDNFLFTGSKRNLFEFIQGVDVFKWIQPWPLKDNKFAVLYDRNNTWYPERDHTFTMSAGFGGNQTYRDLNQYVLMNNSAVLPYWLPEPAHCNRLSGTDGEFFRPFLNSSEGLEVYTADICRKLLLKFKGITSMSGITVYKYVIDNRTWQSAKSYPENSCYCLRKDAECDLDGLMDVSSCVAPNVVASGAHFLGGSPQLRTRVTGLTPPNETLHEPVLMVEPNTGITVQVKAPLQLNVRLERGGFDVFNFFKDDTPLILPLLTITEAADLTEDQAALLRSKLLLLDSWLVSMVLGGTIVFVLVVIVVGSILCMKFRRTRGLFRRQPTESEPLLQQTEQYDEEAGQANGQGQSTNYRTI